MLQCGLHVLVLYDFIGAGSAHTALSVTARVSALYVPFSVEEYVRELGTDTIC